jgi:hypothetical protein
MTKQDRRLARRLARDVRRAATGATVDLVELLVAPVDEASLDVCALPALKRVRRIHAMAVELLALLEG